MQTLPISNSHSESKTHLADINLLKNGSKVKLSDELALLAMKRRETADQFSLHHTVFTIECDGETDTHDLHNTVVSLLAKSPIHWNTIDFDANEKNISGQPDIFRYLKPSNIITAAKKAGIVPSSLQTLAAAYALIFAVCFGIVGLVRLLLGPEPVSGSPEKNIFTEWPLMMIAGICVLLGWFVFTIFHNRGLLRNNNIRVRIFDYANSVMMKKQGEDHFTKKIEESVLGLGMPMAVIINNPNGLDGFTQHIFSRILSDDNHYTVGIMLWIILKMKIDDPITTSVMAMERRGSDQRNVITYHYTLSRPDKPVVHSTKAA